MYVISDNNKVSVFILIQNNQIQEALIIVDIKICNLLTHLFNLQLQKLHHRPSSYKKNPQLSK